MESTKSSFSETNSQYRHIFIASLIFFIIFLITIFYRQWADVYNLDFNDNDNYMRYLQFTHWIEFGNWYLEPLPRFNPEDGQIMHWSRLVDIPLVLITKLATLFTDFHHAVTFAMILVPMLYLFATACCIGYFSQKYFNADVAGIAVIFTYASPLIVKFSGGCIDHHNLQIFLLSAIIASSPLIQTRYHVALLQGLFIALSLWAGLENIFIIALLMALISMQALIKEDDKIFAYHSTSCFSAAIFGLGFLLINRPLDEFLIPYYDAISIPFLTGFTAAGIFCFITHLCIRKYSNHLWKKTIIAAFLSFTPVIILYPDLIYGAFHNYPEILDHYWLSKVNEAISIFNLVSTHGLNDFIYILAVLPALFLPAMVKMTERYWLYYIVLIIALLIPLFWQIRTIFDAYILAIPAQAFVCSKLREKFHFTLLRLAMIFITAPSVIVVAFCAIAPEKEHSSISDVKDAIALLNKHNIHDSLIQAPVDYGSKILTFTDNRIIAAPYHRNIKGNTGNINIFISEKDKKACELLRENKIDYILISKDNPAAMYIEKKDIFLMRLLSETVSNDCIRLTDKDKNVRLYEVLK